MKNKIVKKVMKKLSKKPMLGSFYILNGAIYYSTIKNGLDHKVLWKYIIGELFPEVRGEELKELNSIHYAAERGRLSWSGEVIDGEIVGEGYFILEGTPSCAPYEHKLKFLFGVTSRKVKVDWLDNPVYFVDKKEKDIFQKYLDKYSIKLNSTHVASEIKLIEIK